jgi:hypothetical protein
VLGVANENCAGHGDPAEFAGFVNALNRTIKPLGMEIAKGHMEDTGEVWYGLVNRNCDAAAKISSGYTPAELELFDKALEMVVMSESGTASSTDLLRTVPSLERKLTHRDAQAFLKNLCRDKWLKEKSGVLSPGPRFILELRPFLQELFGEDITQCHLCKETAIQGQKCCNGTCTTKLHLHCAAKLFSGRSTIRCPNCHGDWPHPPPQIDPSHLNDDEDLSVVATTSSNSEAAAVVAGGSTRGETDSTGGGGRVKGRGGKKGKAKATVSSK